MAVNYHGIPYGMPQLIFVNLISFLVFYCDLMMAVYTPK
jgi:hypothetical protein